MISARLWEELISPPFPCNNHSKVSDQKRALEIAEIHLQKMNPTRWDGTGARPSGFDNRIRLAAWIIFRQSFCTEIFELSLIHSLSFPDPFPVAAFIPSLTLPHGLLQEDIPLSGCRKVALRLEDGSISHAARGGQPLLEPHSVRGGSSQSTRF